VFIVLLWVFFKKWQRNREFRNPALPAPRREGKGRHKKGHRTGAVSSPATPGKTPGPSL
jgi:hypothetical protein